jgi:F-type H+-transporting ATPase subunit epsilon
MAETGNQIRVRMVTPDSVLLDTTADAVEIPSKSGYFEVLYGHAPLLAELDVGPVRIHGGPEGNDEVYVVTWGFCEVLPDRVTILAVGATKPQDIDQAQAKLQLEHGHKMWDEAGAEPEKFARANQVIHEAEAKLASVKEGQK